MYLVGRDPGLVAGVGKVVRRFGGGFWVREVRAWRPVVSEFRSHGGAVAHLTMYGEHLDDVQARLRRIAVERDLLLVVGAEKVPAEVYLEADFNVAVANQPHSEVAALAIFLDRLQDGGGLHHGFPGARVRILPNLRGKSVEGGDAGPGVR